MRNNHEIDYKIYGEELQFVEIELDPGETVIGEPGGFMMMEDGIQMETLFGDGSQQPSGGGLMGKLLPNVPKLNREVSQRSDNKPECQ